jgi:wyosine [tRNA(Phe)-imidazoG37] synthetase (radical SAM superfamily)
MEKSKENSAADYIIAPAVTLSGVGSPWVSRNFFMLNVNDHSRESAGLSYVYPVVSRRAGGVSVGINLNINNACNWACIYCQVPNLVRGGPLPVNLELLETELRKFLEDVTQGDFLARNVPPEARRLVDVAFSGNGEPTSAAEFEEAIICVQRVLSEFSLLESIKVRLITNGSFLHRPLVQRGIARIGEMDGEVWFKVDRGSVEGVALVNGVQLAPARIKASLLQCVGLAPTWVQTCYFAFDGVEADEKEQSSYLELIEAVRGKIKGVHLYGIARPSLQPGATKLSNLSQESFQRFAQRISSLGIRVVANP